MILWEDTVSVSQARFKPTGSALPAAVQTMGTRDLILGTPSCPKLAHPAATHGQGWVPQGCRQHLGSHGREGNGLTQTSTKKNLFLQEQASLLQWKGLICFCHQLPAPTLPAGSTAACSAGCHLPAPPAKGCRAARSTAPCSHLLPAPSPHPRVTSAQLAGTERVPASSNCSFLQLCTACSRTWGTKHNRIGEGALLKHQSLALGRQNWPTGKQQWKATHCILASFWLCLQAPALHKPLDGGCTQEPNQQNRAEPHKVRAVSAMRGQGNPSFQADIQDTKLNLSWGEC